MSVPLEVPTPELRAALRNAARLRPTSVARRHTRIALGLDSFTAGPGSRSGGVLPSLESVLRPVLGDGGFGLYGFHTLTPGVYTSISGGAGTITSYTGANSAWSLRSHSLQGIGVAFAGVTTASAGIDPSVAWDHAVVYFEIAAGSSFGYSAASGINGSSVGTVTDAKFPTGKLCALHLTRGTGESATNIAFYSMVGTITIYAVEFLNDAGGVTLTDAAVSGSTIAQHAGLDEEWQKQWVELLSPDTYVLNGGGNDQTSADAAAYSYLVSVMVRRWQRNGARVLLVRPPDRSDTLSPGTYLRDYTGVLKSAALSMGCGYVDARDALGDYAAANAAGYMADTTHLSASGNGLLAQLIAAAIL